LNWRGGLFLKMAGFSNFRIDVGVMFAEGAGVTSAIEPLKVNHPAAV